VAFLEVAKNLGNLGEAGGARAEVQVEIYQWQAKFRDRDFGKEKTFFTDGAVAKRDRLAFLQGVTREKGITVAKFNEASAVGSDAVKGVGITGVIAQVG